MSYYECNLPAQSDLTAFAPYTDNEETHVRSRLAAMCQRMHERTDKLNEALDRCGIQPKTFSEIARMIFQNNPEFDDMTAERLAGAVAAIYDARAYDLSVESAPDRIEWPNATVLFDRDFATTAEWELLRRLGIGGSEAAVVKDISPYKSPRELQVEKRGIPERSPDRGNPAVFARGHFVEGQVIDTFCRLNNATRIPESRMFASKTHPHCTANPDAIVRMENGELCIFEAKTTVQENRKAWVNDQIPPHYIPQILQYGGVLNDDRITGVWIGCLFTVDYTKDGDYLGSTYDGSDFLCHFQERLKDMETDLMDMEEDYWRRYIAGNETPNTSRAKVYGKNMLRDYRLAESLAPEAAGSAKNAVSLKGNETLVDAAWRGMELTQEKAGLNKRIREIDAAIQELAIPFIGILGDRQVGNTDEKNGQYVEVSNKPLSDRRSIDYDRLRAERPDVYDGYVTVTHPSPDRSFRFTLKGRYKK